MHNHKYASTSKIQHICSTIADKVNFKEKNTLSNCFVANFWAIYILIPNKILHEVYTRVYIRQIGVRPLPHMSASGDPVQLLYPSYNSKVNIHISLRLGMLIAFSNST